MSEAVDAAAAAAAAAIDTAAIETVEEDAVANNHVDDSGVAAARAAASEAQPVQQYPQPQQYPPDPDVRHLLDSAARPVSRDDLCRLAARVDHWTPDLAAAYLLAASRHLGGAAHHAVSPSVVQDILQVCACCVLCCVVLCSCVFWCCDGVVLCCVAANKNLLVALKCLSFYSMLCSMTGDMPLVQADILFLCN